MRFVCLVLMWMTVAGALVSGVQGLAGAQMAVTASASDAVVRRWAGSYVYEDALGEIPAGSGYHAYVTYKLRVPKSASQPVTLNADGFQTQDRIRCAMFGDEDRIDVRFVSFADGSVVNQFGVAVYQPNDVLFTLKRVRTNGAQALVTEWKALKPDGVSKQQGSYLKLVAPSKSHTRKEE